MHSSKETDAELRRAADATIWGLANLLSRPGTNPAVDSTSQSGLWASAVDSRPSGKGLSMGSRSRQGVHMACFQLAPAGGRTAEQIPAATPPSHAAPRWQAPHCRTPSPASFRRCSPSRLQPNRLAFPLEYTHSCDAACRDAQQHCRRQPAEKAQTLIVRLRAAAATAAETQRCAEAMQMHEEARWS